MQDLEQELPWIDKKLINGFVDAFNNNHALLIHGQKDIGKSYLSYRLCQKLLNSNANEVLTPLLNAGTHPDIHVLTSALGYQDLTAQMQKFSFRYLSADSLEKKRLSRQISVDTVRRLIESMSESAAMGDKKLIVIHPAEHLNINSANAMLKFLEEPTDRTLLILISNDVSRLPATVRSRCMQVAVPLPDAELSLKWLQSRHPERSENDIRTALNLAANKPLSAERFINDDQQQFVKQLTDDLSSVIVNQQSNIVEISRKWAKFKQTDFILSWLGYYFSTLIKVKLSKDMSDQEPNHQSNSIAQGISVDNLFNVYDYLTSLARSYDGVIDEVLLIEDMLITILNASEHGQVNAK